MAITQTSSTNSDYSEPNSGMPNTGLAGIRGSASNKKLLDYANECFRRDKEYRQQFENQWYMNLAFYFGRHYMQSIASQGMITRLIEPPAPPWRVRLVSNRVRVMLRKEMAKLTKEEPMGFVIPQSSDDEDILAAQAGDNLAQYFWREQDMMKHIRRAVFWMSLIGTGFIKDGYDEKARFDAVQRGNVFCDRVSPFHIFVPDVQEEELENQPHVIHAVAKNPDAVERMYGTSVKADSTGTDILEDKFLSALGIKQSSTKTQVYVKEMWLKPCKMMKDGGIIIFTQDQLIKAIEGWPFQHGQYPFSKFDLMPTGRFYSESSMVDLIPLQKEYNRTRSQLVEAKNRMAKPQLLAPRGSVDPNKITSEPGLVIQYTPGFQPPTPLTLANIPQYVIEELNRSYSDMEDISSQHAISRGGTPAGVHAATAISYLQEQDDSVLAYSIASIESGVERVTRHWLSYVTQFWDSQRQIQVAGENGAFEMYILDKNSLNSNTNYTIQAGSATPRSLAAKQAFIMELYKMGLVPPDKALHYLQMSETGKMYEELQVNARQAQRENVKLSQGDQTVRVNTWDEHLAHIQEHDNYRKRQSYETLPPELQQLFEQHVQHHKAFVLTHKGMPEELVNQALNDPSGLMLDRLLYAPLPGMMPQGPPGGGPPNMPPKIPPKPTGPAPGTPLRGNSPGSPQSVGNPEPGPE
jgi:hypothetical protein